MFRDTQFILSQRGLEDKISLTKKHSSSSSSSSSSKHQSQDRRQLQGLFSQLSKHMVKALHDKYRLDFSMFDYSLQGFIEHASDSEGMMPDVIKEVEEVKVEEEEVEEVEGEEEGNIKESESTMIPGV